jgi:hypothetical protein
MSPNHNPAVASFECFPGYDSGAHNPTTVLLTCHNPTEKVSLETRDFRADVASQERRARLVGSQTQSEHDLRDATLCGKWR